MEPELSVDMNKIVIFVYVSDSPEAKNKFNLM